MTDLEIYQTLRDQFRLIDNNLDKLAAKCTTFQQAQQLSNDWNDANVNMLKARNRLFSQNANQIKGIFDKLTETQKSLSESIDSLENISSVLDKISDVVRLATSIVGLGVPVL
jgi:type I site-specific restriction endonuclease